MSQELNLDDLRKVAEAEETQKWGRWAVEEDDFDGYCVYINDGGIGRSYVARDMHQGGSEGKSTAKFIATFNPATVLALLNRLEQAEQAVQRVRDMADEMGEGKAFGILTRGREDEYPISYFIEMLEEALDGDGRG